MYTLSLHDALPISTGSMRHDRIALRQTPEPPLQQQMPPSRTRLDPAIERPTHRASAKPCRPHPPRDSTPTPLNGTRCHDFYARLVPIPRGEDLRDIPLLSA